MTALARLLAFSQGVGMDSASVSIPSRAASGVLSCFAVAPSLRADHDPLRSPTFTRNRYGANGRYRPDRRSRIH
ncbi:MAG: hypothetical protein ABSF35_16465, partial [Polyangia bacterium]